MSGCATSPYVVTSASEQARQPARAEQRTADEFRRHGASDAAPQAQARADAQHAQARRKPESFLDWLVDTLFSSWLESGK